MTILYLQQPLVVVLYAHSCKPKVLGATSLKIQRKQGGVVKLSIFTDIPINNCNLLTIEFSSNSVCENINLYDAVIYN